MTQDLNRESATNAKQAVDIMPEHELRAWLKAKAWTDRMLAALVNGVKGNKWFSLIDKVARSDTLLHAWELVRRNRGAAGVDKVTIERFEASSHIYIPETLKELEDGTYRPLAIRRVYIPKGDGKERPLGIPTVKDRIVQAAIKLIIEPIFEVEFRPTSFGFRPGKGCKDALREVNRLLQEGYTWVVDADLKSYFDTIPHDKLMQRVEERIADGKVLTLIRSFLGQKILEDMNEWIPESGTPQGAVLSPLLSNIYLHPLDLLMEQSGFKMVRYADDFVVLCKDQETAKRALSMIQSWVNENGLVLHPEKTRLGNCLIEGQGFEFLGYRFEAGRRQVRKKSLNKMKDKVRSCTRRTNGQSLTGIVERLNPILRGWFGYFKHAHHWIFGSLDGWIRRRLRAILRKYEKRPGHGRTISDHMRWPNAFFAKQGLFSLQKAWSLEVASRSR